MKKALTILLAAVLVLGLFACAKSGTALKPLEDSFTVAEPMGDITCAASFKTEDLKQTEAGWELTVTLYDYDRYDSAAVQALKKGDTITVQGKEITVDTVEIKDEFVTINGGQENDGVDLLSEEGHYRTMSWDDHPLYIEKGTVTVPVSETLRVLDQGGPEPDSAMIETGFADLPDGLHSYEGDWTALNTRVTIEGGAVTGIARFWIP